MLCYGGFFLLITCIIILILAVSLMDICTQQTFRRIEMEEGATNNWRDCLRD